MGLAIGIDLGTTYSCVAHYDTNTDNVQIFRNRDDRRTSQSIVTFTNEEALVSCDATPTYARWPLSTVSNVKRLVGRMYTDPEVQADAEKLPYEVVDQDGKAAIRVKYREKMEVFQPEQISAMILTKMKEIAEDTLGEQVTDAVITVPAYFDSVQRQATMYAARIAGLNVLGIIDEPIAVALAYGHDNAIKDGRNILVYDLGGGTFDVSIVSIKNDAYEVKATGGNTHLGGEDFDSRLVNYCVNEIETRHCLNIEGNTEAMTRLRGACQAAKNELTDKNEKTITIPRLFSNVDFTCNISREKFESLCIDLFTSTLEIIESVLADSGLNKDSIDEIVLVGGSSRIPKIQELIRDMFDGKTLSRSIEPDEIVTYGAALQAGLLKEGERSNNSAPLPIDVTPLGYFRSETTAVGIHLGTAFSRVAHYSNCPRVISNNYGNRMTPSCVHFCESERLVGEDAEAMKDFYPLSTIFNATRLIGRKYSDPEMGRNITKLPFSIIDQDGKPMVKAWRGSKVVLLRPEEISAMMLEKMKEVAEGYLGYYVKDAVITVPAYFNDAQRQATKDAARIAGINALRIINEPTAAALAYVVDNNIKGKRNILVFDLGGGTFDVSIMKVNDNMLKVVATGGDRHLGGDDFDACLLECFAKEFRAKSGIDILSDKKATIRLLTECQRAKIRLSNAKYARWSMAYLSGTQDHESQITRSKYEFLCEHLFKRIMDVVKQVLADSKLNKDKIDDIVLVGGSSRMPKIREDLSAFFSKSEIKKSIDPDEAVAKGAAIQAALLLPDPPEELKHLKLSDVTPLTLGMVDSSNMMLKIVPRNTAIPLTVTKSFVTSHDYQTVLTFSVYQGERAIAANNVLLGSFQLSQIPAAPCGAIRVEVTFEVDEDSILRVTAVHKESGRSNKITITQYNRIPRESIERIIAESERYRAEDEALKARVAARHTLKKLAVSTLNDLRDKISIVGNSVDNHRSEVRHIIRVNRIIEWIDDNPDATKDQYLGKKREVEGIIDMLVN